MRTFFALVLVTSLLACNPQGSGPLGTNEEEEEEVLPGEWLIPSDEVIDGGPGKDGIPSIDIPNFIGPEQVDYLFDSDFVVVVAVGETTRVYPHPVLDWHEIVNDRVDDFAFALTYCPLTGTASNWNRTINGKETTFGVSGLLYNSNLIPYDRETDSNWSQMRLDCVNGENQGDSVETSPVFETTWEQAKKIDNIEVLSTETGFSRNYGNYPYGDYRTNHNNLIFPLSNTDNRKKTKDRVLGVLEFGVPKIYGFDNFLSETDEIIIDTYRGKNIMVVGNKAKNYITAFYPTEGRAFDPLMNEFPYIVQDDLGNQYDIFGRSRLTDDRLEQPEQFIGYWFSWAAFYPNLLIYEN